MRPPASWAARGLTRADFDLTDFAAVRAAFERDRPQLVIHCAALSKTGVCEAHPDAAHLHNVEVTRVLCELASDLPLIFFSTDLVFDGTKGNYCETDAPNPLNVYARTKVAAERLVLANPRHTVVRTSLNAGRTLRGDAFNEQWCAAWRRGEVLQLFTDEFRCPIAAEVTARALWELVAAGQPGLYHLAGRERLVALRNRHAPRRAMAPAPVPAGAVLHPGFSRPAPFPGLFARRQQGGPAALLCAAPLQRLAGSQSPLTKLFDVRRKVWWLARGPGLPHEKAG